MRKIILASTSPRRKDILEKLRIPFSIEDSGYKEDMGLKLKPRELARHLALGKAKAVAKRHKNTIVIGADTIVVAKNRVLGKPRDASHAMEMLKFLSGSVHKVITGFAIIDTKNNKRVSKAVETKVYFRKLTEREIQDYVDSGEAHGKAGAYAIQVLAGVFVRKVEGDYLNIVGLPLAAVLESLKKLGVL